MSEPLSASATPLVFQEIATGNRERGYAYRPFRGMTFALMGLGGLKCLILVASIAGHIHQLAVLTQVGQHQFGSRSEMMAAASASDRFVGLVSVFFLLTLIPTYVVAGLWIYRAACNTRALGARRLENSPGWAVGWYFVPVMSLFKPLGAMAEIWNGSQSPDGWKSKPVPGLLYLWWGLWIGGNIAGNLLFLARGFRTIPSMILTTQGTIAALAVDVVATSLFLTAVWRIASFQSRSQDSARDLASVFN